jgi:hypothetical protein
MKILITLSLFAVIGLVPRLANSETVTVDFPIVCSNMKALSEVIAEYKEQPAMTMSSVRDTGSDRPMLNRLVLFVNYETKTWTMGEQISPDLVCLIAVGDSIQPYKEK